MSWKTVKYRPRTISLPQLWSTLNLTNFSYICYTTQCKNGPLNNHHSFDTLVLFLFLPTLPLHSFTTFDHILSACFPHACASLSSSTFVFTVSILIDARIITLKCICSIPYNSYYINSHGQLVNVKPFKWKSMNCIK